MADSRENVVSAMWKLFNTSDPQDVVAQINSDLNTAKKRWQGLLVLQQMLHQCTAEMFSSNFQTWLNLLLQLLQSYASPEQQQLALQIMSTMIQKVTAFPELSRDMGTNRVKTILPVLLPSTSKFQQKTKEAVTSCLCSCMLHFPGPTSFFKTKIESMLELELDSSIPSQVYIRCYALLARCGNGNQRDKQREAWRTQYEKLLSTLKSILSKLYVGLESGEEVGEDQLFMFHVPNVQPDQMACLVRRFSTLCACLGTLLREPFPTWVPLNMTEILRLSCRTLAVQPDMLMAKGSTDHVLLMTYLPLMYSSIMTLLSNLVICGKKLLISNGNMLVSLCVQCLAASRMHKAGSRPFRKVRQQVYQTLGTWLQVAGSSSMTHFAADGPLRDLLTQIFTDIAPQQPEALQLEKSLQRTDTQPPARKKRRRNNAHQELSINAHTFLPDTEELVSSGLKALIQVINSTAIFMEEKLFKGLKDKVCDLVSEVQRSPLPPYTSPGCRQLLYQVLMASVLIPRPDPCHVQYAISLLQRGVMDTEFVVAVTCREGLTLCQNLIHPRTPCLLAPVTKPAKLNGAIDIVEDSTTTVAASVAYSSVFSTPSHKTLPDSNTVSTVPEASSSSSVQVLVRPQSQQTSVSSSDSGENPPHRVRSESGSDAAEDSEESFPRMEEVAGTSINGAVVSEEVAEESSMDSADVKEEVVGTSFVDKEELAGTSSVDKEEFGTSCVDGVVDKLPEVMETEMNAGMSAMLSSFVPCEADPDDDSDSD